MTGKVGWPNGGNGVEVTVRVIGGRYRSRKLPAPPPARTRPTSDRLRETLFNILASSVIESRFLDAYAGVGAVGIEALSRGASGVVFVDSSPVACRSIRRNLEALGIAEDGQVQVRVGHLDELVREWDGPGFDIVFVDPPYARDDLYRRDIELFGGGSVLAPGGTVIAEHRPKTVLPASAGGLRRVRVHPQGSSALTFYRWEHECERSGNR